MSRPVVIAVIGFAAALSAVVLFLSTEGEERGEPPAAASAPSTQAIPPVAADLRAPSFDVVRIGEKGDAVIAGRAMPKAEVVIFDGGAEIGRVVADGRGEWVFVPNLPMAAGARALMLEAHNPDGSVTRSGEPVVLVVPEHAGLPALAVKARAGGGARLMQGPAAGEGTGPLTIDMVDHDENGGLFVGGRAEPGATIHIYMNNKLFGRGKADGDGAWSVGGKPPGHAGEHRLRADHVDGKGKVVARIEIAYEAGADLAPLAAGTVVVKPGNSLWRIARQLYGSGPAFSVIYQANKDDIRDPNLIYPGQVFTVPTGAR